MLQIYNTLTKQKEPLQPIHPKKVAMYVCGMTVYDYCHIGHARTMVAFDVIYRYLKQQGFDVTYVRNITDIDDKIIKRANENNEPFEQLTQRFIQAMWDDSDALGILPPDQQPKATDHIDNIVTMIQALIDNNHAYVASNGDVYYSIKQFTEYGKLSQKNLEQLQAGSRVEVSKAKDNPLDFVLWKLAKPNEPQWDSPWGAGRPGWHIECSAMSTNMLGHHFDIHGGGFDLIFPHHENEIAQSEACTGVKFVNTWMHVGFVQVDKEKMSKSLGNFFTIREVLDKYPAEVVRYFLLSSHYRSPLNYSDDALDNAHAALQRLYLSLRDITIDETIDISQNPFYQSYCDAMNDDFNTPVALATLFAIAREINRIKATDVEQTKELAGVLKQIANTLGFLQQSPEDFLHTFKDNNVSAEDIEALISAREKARADKNWTEADKLRAQLDEMGVVLEDSTQGTTWRKI